MRKIFYGWVIVGAGLLITCFGMGTVMTFGVFLQPMEQATGWSRTAISTAPLLNFLAMGVAGFAWGAASDRFGTRIVVLAGGLLLGLALTLASRASALWEFQLSFGLLAGIAAGAFIAPLTAIAARWFTRHRSIAVALVTAGVGIGSITIAPLSRWIITDYDWQTAMLVLGLLAWAVVLPAGMLLRPPPAATVAPQPGDASMTAGQALRSPQLAAVAFTFFACCACHSGPIFHMVTYAIECGVAPMAAATAFGAMGLAALGGRIFGGLMADRLGAKRIILAGLAVQAVSVSFYLLTRDPANFYAVGILFGLSYGTVMPLYAVLVREWFGPAVMGTAFGAVTMVSTIGMAIGPVAGGWLYDSWGSYAWLFIGSAGIGLGALAIAFTFRPPARPGLPAMLAAA